MAIDVTLERKFPNNLEAERSVLGAILLDNDAFHPASEILQPGDFFLASHRRIFAQIIKLSEQNGAIDLVTLNEDLERAGELEAAGGTAYLSSLVDGVPRISHVEHYARIVKRKALLRKLAGFGDRICQRAFDARLDPLEVLNRAAQELEFLSSQYRVEAWAERKLAFRTGAELARETPAATEWIARPWVAAGSITELAGKVKLAGKTTFVTHLVAALLDGASFLGQATSPTPVVYLTEQPPASFRVAMERARLVGRPDFVVLPWNNTVGHSWEMVARSAVEECKRRDAKLLVVDTLGQFAGLVGDSENNAGDALRALQPLQTAAAQGLSIIVVRHERKSGGVVGDAGRGSSAYAGAVDIVLSLRRLGGNTRPTVRAIHGISRFNDVPDELVVELVDGTFVPRGRAADVAAREAEAIILAAAPPSEQEAMTVDDLVEGADVKRATAHRSVKVLFAGGKLARTGSGRKGNAFRYFIAEKLSSQASTLYETKETETVRAGLKAGRRAGFRGDPVKKPDKPDGSGEADGSEEADL